uniref:DUF3300 domain-containing protein n=1 Tax=Schlesneria paludicola TaxID=360056 RepID=A0A7C4LS89_9PLAN
MKLLATGKWLLILSSAVLALSLPGSARADEVPPVPADSTARLSPQTLQALVVGIALYPDPVIELILQAAQFPAAIHEAASIPASEVGRLSELRNSGKLPVSVQTLLDKYPDVLAQLDRNIALTTALGQAAKNQLADVWAAIDAVRESIEKTAAQQPAAAVVNPYVAAAGIVARRLYGPGVIAELAALHYIAHHYYPYPYPYPAGTTTVVTGPYAAAVQSSTTGVTTGGGTVTTNSTTGVYAGPAGATATGTGSSVVYQKGATTAAAGTGTAQITTPHGTTAVATGSGIAGKTTVGNTTVAGAAGTGTITTSTGKVATGTGVVGGTVTQTQNGAVYSTQAAGTYATNTGKSGSAYRSSSGAVTTNPDGSVSATRSVQLDAATTGGAVSVDKQQAATITGTGGGSYQGTTTIDSTKGTAQVQTSAANGQVNTTVTTDQGSKSVTLGDGQVNAAGNAAKQPSSSTTRRTGTSAARYSQVNAEQLHIAQQSMQQGFAELNSQVAQSVRGSVRSSGAARPAESSSRPQAAPAAPAPSFSRPGAGGMSGRSGGSPPAGRGGGRGRR